MQLFESNDQFTQFDIYNIDFNPRDNLKMLIGVVLNEIIFYEPLNLIHLQNELPYSTTWLTFEFKSINRPKLLIYDEDRHVARINPSNYRQLLMNSAYQWRYQILCSYFVNCKLCD